MTRDGRRALPGDLLRRIARRVCSADAYDRIALPVIADLQHEWRAAVEKGRPLAAAWIRLRGSIAFWQTVTLLGASSMRRDVVSRDGARFIGRSLVAFVIFTVMLAGWGLEIPGPLDRTKLWIGLLLLPSVIGVTLPMGLLLGAWLGGRHAYMADQRSARRAAVTVSLAAALLAFGLFGWVLPRANQAVRQEIFTRVTGSDRPLAPGDREMTLAELQRGLQTIDPNLDRTRSEALKAEWHKRLALPAACMVLTLLGLACADARGVRTIPVMAVLYPAIVVTYHLLLRTGEQLADGGRLTAWLAIWTPNVVALVAASLLSRLRRPPAIAP